MNYSRNALVLAAVLIAAGAARAASEPVDPRSVPLSDFRAGRRVIIGELGVPLGRVVRVEATVVAAAALWPDSQVFRDRYLLAVTAIDGRDTKPIHLPFQVNRFAVSRLYASRPELAGQLRGELQRDPTPAEVARDEARLLGAGPRTLFVYESVTFAGVPAEIPQGVPLWSGLEFGPSSRLVVIRELDRD